MPGSKNVHDLSFVDATLDREAVMQLDNTGKDESRYFSTVKTFSTGTKNKKKIKILIGVHRTEGSFSAQFSARL